jgi:hypothetical protein
MILDHGGDKCSPKRKAQEILAYGIEKKIEEWIDGNPDQLAKMTDRELDLLNEQLEKQLKRVLKLMGIEYLKHEDGQHEEVCPVPAGDCACCGNTATHKDGIYCMHCEDCGCEMPGGGPAC